MNFRETVIAFEEWRSKHNPKITIATVEVTEGYARRVFGIKKGGALEYKGLTLRCIGSRLWRARHAK